MKASPNAKYSGSTSARMPLTARCRACSGVPAANICSVGNGHTLAHAAGRDIPPSSSQSALRILVRSRPSGEAQRSKIIHRFGAGKLLIRLSILRLSSIILINVVSGRSSSAARRTLRLRRGNQSSAIKAPQIMPIDPYQPNIFRDTNFRATDRLPLGDKGPDESTQRIQLLAKH